MKFKKLNKKFKLNKIYLTNKLNQIYYYPLFCKKKKFEINK